MLMVVADKKWRVKMGELGFLVLEKVQLSEGFLIFGGEGTIE